MKAFPAPAGRRGSALRVVAALGVLAALSAFGQPSPVVINEIMADNATTLRDDVGNYPDWIELYNTGAVDQPLAGWSLTDDRNNPRKFTFRAGAHIAPGGFLVVYCDDATNLPGIHTQFKLSNKGSFVGLTNNAYPPKTDTNTFGLQVADYSIGRVPNGTGAWKLNLPTPGDPNLAATLGLTNVLKINEWAATNHYTVSVGTNGVRITNSGKDWLELYNPATNPVSLGGLVLTTTLPGLIPANKPVANLSFIAPNGFFRFWCIGNQAKANDELDFKLSHNTGETNTLYWTDRVTVIDRISFQGWNTDPNSWSVDISYGRLPDGSNNIVRFAPDRTTPGKSNFQPATNLVVNELLSHTDLPLEDAVEFYNPTPDPVNIGGWWLSNAREDRYKFRVPSNTIVQPYGFKVFYEMVGSVNGFNTNGTGTNRSFTFNAAYGDTVVLTAVSNYVPVGIGDLTGYEVVETFGPAQNGISFGRYVDSTGTNVDFVPMARLTFGSDVTRYDDPSRIYDFRRGQGATNSYPQVGPLVISEIYYHPPDVVEGANHIDDSTNEFIEVYNFNSTNVPLHDPQQWYSDPNYNHGIPYASGWTNTWKVKGDVDFDFPTNVFLAPSNYLLVVNFHTTNTAMSNAFCQKFGVPPGVQIFGPYKGKLPNGHGSIELHKPDWPQGPAHLDELGFVPYLLVEDVKYKDSSPWPTNSDGRGSSLHRVSPTGYGNDPTNWVDSVPSPGRAKTLLLLDSGYATAGSNYVFGFTAQAGMSYTVQARRSFDSAVNWVNLQSYAPFPADKIQWITNSSSFVDTSWFYRVVSPRQ